MSLTGLSSVNWIKLSVGIDFRWGCGYASNFDRNLSIYIEDALKVARIIVCTNWIDDLILQRVLTFIFKTFLLLWWCTAQISSIYWIEMFENTARDEQCILECL